MHDHMIVWVPIETIHSHRPFIHLVYNIIHDDTVTTFMNTISDYNCLFLIHELFHHCKMASILKGLTKTEAFMKDVIRRHHSLI